MKQSYAAWRWGTSEDRADAVVGALSYFFEPSSYEPDFEQIRISIITAKDSFFDKEGVISGLLGGILGFDISMNTPYQCSGEFVDWIARRHIQESPEYAAVQLWAKAKEPRGALLFSGSMYKKRSGL